ncbi:MAG: PIN domain-containing protein [Actinomycetia bacterium]|nr:PIN domain-containing protein [Actinomycetes bacterium]
MIIPDTNLLLYSIFTQYPQHARANDWWASCLNGRETIGIPPVVAAAFMRVSTNPRAYETPLMPDVASTLMATWISRPMVHVLTSGQRHVALSLDMIRAIGTAGNLTTDAQIAAHARIENAIVATNDTDFGRFPDIRTVNPLRD